MAHEWGIVPTTLSKPVDTARLVPRRMFIVVAQPLMPYNQHRWKEAVSGQTTRFYRKGVLKQCPSSDIIYDGCQATGSLLHCGSRLLSMLALLAVPDVF